MAYFLEENRKFAGGSNGFGNDKKIRKRFGSVWRCLELRQYKDNSTQSKKILVLKLPRFPAFALTVSVIKKRCNYKTGNFLTELSCSYIVLALMAKISNSKIKFVLKPSLASQSRIKIDFVTKTSILLELVTKNLEVLHIKML